MVIAALLLLLAGLVALVAAILTGLEVYAFLALGLSSLGLVLRLVDVVLGRVRRSRRRTGSAGGEPDPTEVNEPDPTGVTEPDPTEVTEPDRPG